MSDDVFFESPAYSADSIRRTNWTRWTPEPIQTDPPPTQADTLAHKDTAQRPGPGLKKTLANLRKQAHDKGYNDGYATGHQEGFQQGQAAGQEQGHQDGYQAGYEIGHNEARQHAEQAASNLATLAQNCAGALANIESEIGQELIKLSIRIAEQVLHRTLETQPDTILALIDDILQLDTGKAGALQLFVHPDDLTLIQNYLQDNPDTQLWRVHPDDTITRGGCKARTALGDIDATLEKRWQRVVAAIGGTT